MGLKVAVISLHLSQTSFPHCSSSSQTLASEISSPSSRRCSFLIGDGGLFCRYAERSSLFFDSPQFSKLYRSLSCNSRRFQKRIIRRALIAGMASFSDEEFSKQIEEELALRYQMSDENEGRSSRMDDSAMERLNSCNADSSCEAMFIGNLKPFDALQPPNFSGRDEIIPPNIEFMANCVDIPLSLRIIKRKKQWQEGSMEAGESAYCSAKKAFSSMVFIIRELHRYTLQLREALFYEDLQGILENVQKEIHASFVWLFQKVFSHTPTLMVYLMILLANYSVYSMSSNSAIAASPPVQAYTVATEEVSVVEDKCAANQKFDLSIVKTLKFSSPNGKTASVGGNIGGGGGTFKPIASGTDGDGKFDESNYHPTITPDSVSSSSVRKSGEESISGQESVEDEAVLLNSIAEEASVMRDESSDQETMQTFVSPVDGNVEAVDYLDYLKTEMLYQTELAQEPKNPLLLANYAQFLYLVNHDFDRAEEYFKRATEVEPKDGEALNKYAHFLWRVRNDLWGAEETYLEAISAEPENPYYAASYAHFLWNTGGKDTCFPLDSMESSTDI